MDAGYSGRVSFGHGVVGGARCRDDGMGWPRQRRVIRLANGSTFSVFITDESTLNVIKGATMLNGCIVYTDRL